MRCADGCPVLPPLDSAQVRSRALACRHGFPERGTRSIVDTMRAQVLDRPRSALVLRNLEPPPVLADQVRVQVKACGVCRTDLHVLDAELPRPKLPLVLGHQIVGIVVERGAAVTSVSTGDRVGIPWLGWTDGTCAFCRSGRENLCPAARFTGYTIDGGYAEQVVADARFCFPLSPGLDDVHT